VTRRERAIYVCLLVLGVGSMGAFLGWWFIPAHVPRNFRGSGHTFDFVLFGLLTLVFGHRMFMDALSWVVAWSMRPEIGQIAPQAGLRVAFLTTFVPSSEPMELLYQTLPAMLDADYPHDTWLLDEGNLEAAQECCEQLGVKYFSRAGVRKYNLVAGPFTAKTKGGNHNAWYDSFADDYDVVAQIDTDFVPRKDFLVKTLGHFRDERVGFVVTPQVYGNAAQSFVAKGAAEQLFLFYGALMRGLAARGHANMIGANHVVRVTALREIGLYAGHLTEDLLTGMRLHARGWESRYVHEPLAIGEGPVTWQAYFNQQMRWAFGCMDILRTHSLRLVRTMERRQAALYLALQQHYFSGLAAGLGLLLLVGYFGAGFSPARVGLEQMLIWLTPLVIARQAIGLWLQRFSPAGAKRGLLLSGRYSAVVTWPIYLLAAIGVARQRRLVFKVTPKGASQDDRTPTTMIIPHLTVGLIAATCLVSAAFTHRQSVPMLFWAAMSCTLMLSFVVLVLMTRVRRPHPALRAHRARHALGQIRAARPSTILVNAHIVDDHLLRP
jgi:cellulose synthase (UDP-forming)